MLYIFHDTEEQGTISCSQRLKFFFYRGTLIKVDAKIDENDANNNIYNLLLIYFIPGSGTYYLHLASLFIIMTVLKIRPVVPKWCI